MGNGVWERLAGLACAHSSDHGFEVWGISVMVFGRDPDWDERETGIAA